MSARLLLVAAIAAAQAACGCASDADDWEAGRPRIDRLRFLQQRPGDPHALEFSITFTDSDGNLGDRGTLYMAIGGQQAQMLTCAEVFASQVPPIEPAATEGEFEVVVRVQEDFPIGERIEIGFALDDGTGGECSRSNEPHVVLEAFMPDGM